MALCLAAEADHLEDTGDESASPLSGPKPRGGDRFRTIAAGVTWLERRHAGIDPAVETIMLIQD
jgi:hypothetical protein